MKFNAHVRLLNPPPVSVPVFSRYDESQNLHNDFKMITAQKNPLLFTEEGLVIIGIV
jgi:hypothetical protein